MQLFPPDGRSTQSMQSEKLKEGKQERVKRHEHKGKRDLDYPLLSNQSYGDAMSVSLGGEPMAAVE